jgi:hypothetical protein
VDNIGCREAENSERGNDTLLGHHRNLQAIHPRHATKNLLSRATYT